MTHSLKGHLSMLPLTLFASLGAMNSLMAQDDSPVPGQALEIVARQKGVFTQPPRIVPTRKVPDGPLLGNGDLGVTLGTTSRLRPKATILAADVRPSI